MKVQMEKALFNSLASDAVGHACFEPMVLIYQAGARGLSENEAKEYRVAFINTLSPGQRALFMFFTYYDHAIRSTSELIRISEYYLSAQIFGAVKKGIAYFHDDVMHQILSEIEQAIGAKNQDEISERYLRMKEISPNTLAAIGAQIKENPAEFICLE